MAAAIRMFVKRSSSEVSTYIDSLQKEDLDKSSIGNVKTLRSKLQARRVTLSEAIEKENLFLKGSQLLESVTSDRKTKDQASMQSDFAESKIKSLQSELMKINSSLHAYQAESAKGVQVPIIPIAMKTTGMLNLTETFRKILKEHYHTDPEDLSESIQQFNELRSSIQSVPRMESGIKQLYQYYNHLMMASKRFLHPKLKHGVTFTWYDGISGFPVVQQSTVFERASVLFNLGALYSQMAANVDRCSMKALDSAIELLENAIGMFEYTKNKFSHSPTMDMTNEILSLISDLMRAQAQEMVWEKELLNGLEDDGLTNFIDYAHKAKSVAECYKPVRELVDDEIIKEYLPDVWISLIKIKEAHYKALAHYYAGRTHHQLASLYEEDRHVPENVRTEVLFLYSDCPQEMLTDHPKLHLGIAKSHINCAALSHEYALKFCTLCRDLHHVTCLTEMLSIAEIRTQQIREVIERENGVKMIAPTIIPCAMQLSSKDPNFEREKVDDLFASLGPLSSFNGERCWSPPHEILLIIDNRGSFGFTVRGSHPVMVSGVDSKGPAERAGMKVRDWILAINGDDVKYKSHDEVVAMVKGCREELTLEMSTPEMVD